MKKYSVLGLMSGTSLDGLDIAHCSLWQEENEWKFSINQATTIPYQEQLYQQLKHAITLSPAAHQQLHITYGKWLGTQAKNFLDTHHISVDFIASHGHTSHHRPAEGITFQLGDGKALAEASGCIVINDFRTLDVALGGQGAPLVPIGDKLLFASHQFCLNLGGISNISFDKEEKRIAYDIGLANMPLNYLTAKIGLAYDENGNLARQGTLLPDLLRQLNALTYYQLPYPKSTGYEWFRAAVIPILEKFKDASTKDLLHTIIHHNCQQIAFSIKKEKPIINTQLLVTGGGALNTFYTQTLTTYLPEGIQLIVPSKTIIDYKEALVFAFMGVLRVENQINILKSVTGASRDSCSGVLHHPN
ncbi:anhydro-N-acetylmuramic acid kinase [Flavobacterium sp. ASW18X]|uniref:anhydro-N-acetylmuramic acid kinase n=1 Tax=Flavobacterium sp. ASW18X TaxID=2572595 RepID=UPI0010AEAB34|nr:anhydro-N-acetylmuramic acid kinase [Flavobacterium sp. ASW18X]TKD62491.1 anhydro-N-acetylmuramic acid kinase [Flavobacterium sp. ASW18X]